MRSNCLLGCRSPLGCPYSLDRYTVYMATRDVLPRARSQDAKGHYRPGAKVGESVLIKVLHSFTLLLSLRFRLFLDASLRIFIVVSQTILSVLIFFLAFPRHSLNQPLHMLNCVLRLFISHQHTQRSLIEPYLPISSIVLILIP